MTELYETIESTEWGELIITKLRQCKLALEEKLVTIRQIDNQILELVVDEDLDDEIEQADIFRERLRRAIMDAENSIEVKRNPSTRSAPDHVTSASVASSMPPESVFTVASASTVSDVSAALDSLVTTDASICVPVTLPSALSSPVTTTRPPVVSVTYSSVGLPPIYLPVIPSYETIGTSPPGVYTTTASSPRAVVTLPAAHIGTPILLGHIAKVKLPKLTLKRFNGDVTKWATFWDSFESSIHNNLRLSDVDKFN